MPFKTLASKLSMQPAPQDRFNRSNVSTTGPIIGGKSIYFFDRDLYEKGVRGFRFYGFFHETTGREEPRVEKEKKFPTLNPVQIATIPDLLRQIVNMLSKQGTVGTTSRLQRIQTTLERYVDSLYSTPMTSNDLELIRKTVLQITYWMKTPLNGCYSNAMSVTRCALSYCSKSIDTYR